MNNSLNVLFLTSWYPVPEYPTHGIFIRNHAKALAHFCNVIVMYVYSSEEAEDVVFEHTQSDQLNEYVIAFPKSKIPVIKQVIHFFKYLYYYYRLSVLVKKHFPIIHFIQINVVFPVAVFFPLIKNYFKIKSYTVFEQWTGYLKEDNLYKGIIRKFFTKHTIQNAGKVWCLCDYQKQSMIKNGLFANYEVMGNVVHTNIFKLSNKGTNNKKTFLHISTLDDRQKNITGILKPFKEIEKEGYDFQLIIIGGKDDYLNYAKAFANKLELKNIEFKGIVSQEELPRYYQSADALVMFSNYETFCVVVYEALGCGIYVITTNVADLDKIISDDIGTIVPVKDEQKLKSAIIDVLENKIYVDSVKAHQLIENNFSEKTIGEKIFNYYQSLI